MMCFNNSTYNIYEEGEKMKNRRSARLYTTSASIMLIVILLSLTGALLSTSRAVLGTDSVTGAIWTTDPDGERVNGNLYTKAQDVYLAGGPHKKGAAGLPDGIYYFQVTDPPGKELLSTKDDISDRRFNVTNGYIYSIDDGTHKWNPDDIRNYGIVVQLWPFIYTPKTGGVYKVWVTMEDHYDQTQLQGCFGFIPSLSKTDNFKVGGALDEVPKYFELWVTEGISGPIDIEFYVYYTIDEEGNPVLPWTEGQLTFDRTENGYDVFRYETSFAMGTYIYWQFFAQRVFDTFTWTSEIYGPELIDQEGKVNKETLFIVNGHKYNYATNEGLGGWTIELYRDDVKIDETQTGDGGAYDLIGTGTGNFKVCEIAKTDEGWANATPTCYEFTVDGNNDGDLTFDFYNYKMLRISDTSNLRCELSSFDVVFTPSNDDEGKYKLSSTNPGSFYYNTIKYGTAGTPVRIEIDLPQDHENACLDSPNFILHHAHIGSTPVLDVHVYAGRLDPSGWVPDWDEDITHLFDITAPDEKHVTVEGIMPDTGEVFLTVHIDYQISGSVTWDEVQAFSDFEYTFNVMVYFSAQGVHWKLPIFGI